jgi:hypothetical protein
MACKQSERLDSLSAFRIIHAVCQGDTHLEPALSFWTVRMRWACGTRRALSALRDGSEVAQGCADDDMTPHHYPAQLRDWIPAIVEKTHLRARFSAARQLIDVRIRSTVRRLHAI